MRGQLMIEHKTSCHMQFLTTLSLSLTSPGRLTKVLHEILYVGHEDLPILQYWRSALSKEYKTHLMQAART